MTLPFLFVNNVSLVLTQNFALGSTTLHLPTGTGASLPTPVPGQSQFSLTLESLSLGIVTAREIVWCTSISGDICTVVRAQEGTTAQIWPPGSYASARLTAAALNYAFGILASLDPNLIGSAFPSVAGVYWINNGAVYKS